MYVTSSSHGSVLIIVAFSDVTSPLYCVKMGGSSLTGFLQDERVHPVAASDCSSTYTWYWAAVAGGQQDIPCWPWLLIIIVIWMCFCVSLCAGGWGAHPRGSAEHLLGSTPTNQTSDVRWQWKIPSQPVQQPYTHWHTDAFICWINRCGPAVLTGTSHTITEKVSLWKPHPVLFSWGNWGNSFVDSTWVVHDVALLMTDFWNKSLE